MYCLYSQLTCISKNSTINAFSKTLTEDPLMNITVILHIPQEHHHNTS